MYRLAATRANGQPRFGFYIRDPQANVAHTNGLLVLTLAGTRIRAMTRFDNRALPRFGLPEPCPAEHALPRTPPTVLTRAPANPSTGATNPLRGR